MIPAALIPYLVGAGVFVAAVLGAYGYGHSRAAEECRRDQVERMVRAQEDFTRREDRIRSRVGALSTRLEAERVRAATLRGKLEEARQNATLITSDPCPRLAPEFFGMFFDLDAASGSEAASGGARPLRDP